MVFSSLVFLFFFLPITLIVYFLSGKRLKNIVLLLSGLIFYAWGEPLYVLIMIVSAAIDYFAGRLLDKFKRNEKLRRVFLLVSVVMNLGLLAVFKYSSFFIGIINDLTVFDIKDPNLPLPIGISFYTFQSMSYTIDLYRRHIKVQKKFSSFLCYVTLFPQIVAGPIVRYADVANEIDDRTVTADKVSDGIGIFIKGLAKKVLIANNIGMLWTTVKAMEFSEISALTAWLGILAFTFQIYFDFSGYSDMAVGLGKMLGFDFPQNFDHPYISKSVTEFWRRWHITLGTWFREYVYIPLGGNRKGLSRTCINLLITWTLTGFWHGASFNFLLWGLYFGILIVIEKLGFAKILEKLPKIISKLYTFIIAVFGWVLFDTETLADTGKFFKAMFTGNGVFADSTAVYLLSGYLFWFIISALGSTEIFDNSVKKLQDKGSLIYGFTKTLTVSAMLFICIVFLVNATYNPFLYFRF
ncbi:MAG: MBOAT family protein [Ruminococcus sp.]|jgi:alginate O-acetyltransferase complex protein AlgI|nr:MBOAT family protein [Ruminococcus sp.]